MYRMLLIGLAISLTMGFAQDKQPAARYVGTKMCKMCHNKKATGKQYSVWLGTAHAQALDTLRSAKAKEIAAQRGVKGAPDQAPECIQCHVTGWGDESGYQLKVDPNDHRAVSRNKALENVGCEVCHGPGSKYKSKKVMQAIYAGQTDPASVGLVIPTAETCTRCHNDQSPTNKKFVFEEMVKKIAHPIPKSTN